MVTRNPDKDNKVTLKRDEKIPSPFLTRPEAAAYLKMKPESLSNLHGMGKGPTYYKKMGILSGKIGPGKKGRDIADTLPAGMTEEAHDAD